MLAGNQPEADFRLITPCGGVMKTDACSVDLKNRLTGNLYIKSTFTTKAATPPRFNVAYESARCCLLKQLTHLPLTMVCKENT